MNNKNSLTLVEFLVTITLIFIFIGFFGIYANITLKKARETVLLNELNNLRLSLELYQVVNNRKPNDLSVLVNEEYFLNVSGIIVKNRFLKDARFDKKKEVLLDPFYNKYIYDRDKGKIFSSTSQYKDW